MAVFDFGPIKWILSSYKFVADLFFDIFVCLLFAIPLFWIQVYKAIFPSRKSLKGKLVMITGGSSALSKNIAQQLAGMGCNIALVDHNESDATPVARELERKGIKAYRFAADITKVDEITKLRDEVKSKMGPVDILINNAETMPEPGQKVQPEFVEDMIKLNLLGTVQASRVFKEQMKNFNGGHIVSISSLAGIHPSQFINAYAATKSGVNSFMAGFREKLRLEKLDHKIKTTLVCPQFMTNGKDHMLPHSTNMRFPPITIAFAATSIIDAIVKEESVATVPALWMPGYKLMSLFPITIQQLIRDRILRESDYSFLAQD